MAQDAADVGAAADVSRGHAALNHVARAFRGAHDGCRVHAAGDGARHLQVLDGGTVDVAEQRRALVAGVGNGGGDGVPVAVEGAAEGIRQRCARHGAAFLRHADVVGQLHVLAAVAVFEADVVDERVPLVLVADEVRTVLFARALCWP